MNAWASLTSILAAVPGLVGLIVVYSGAYNVAVTENHASFTRWALDTIFHNSVERLAGGVNAPDTMADTF